MEPGSPEWIEKTVEELEYLETARESLANAPVGNGSVPTEGARQAQLAAFDHRIATLFAELEPFAGEEDENTDAGGPLPALSTTLPVAGGAARTQRAVTTHEANAFDDDPFAAPSFSAPEVALGSNPGFDQDPSFEESPTFGSGLGSDYGDDLNAEAPKKKKWVLPAVLGAVGVAACAVVIPMLGSSDAPQADPTLSQPAAAAIAPAATPTPVPEPEAEPVAPPAEAAPAAEQPAAEQPAADAGTQVAANTPEPAAEPEQPAAQESDLEDWENPAVLKMRSPRGRKARRKAKAMKKREARRRRREAVAERRRKGKSSGGKKKGKRRSKRRKGREESASGSEPASSKKRKRKRLDLGGSGDPLG